MKKRWVLREKPDHEVVERLSKELNINTILTTLLIFRGITTYKDAKSFFRPQLTDLLDPFLMKDMDKAVERVISAKTTGEKIMVYGDYDVDGTTAVSIVYSYLKNTHKKVDFYIPDRYKEGYGISYIGIDYAVEHGYKLLISLDCGIKAVEKVDYAKKKGLDIIICDHHRPGEIIPDAVAVLDPKQPDCNYPFKELSGAGVGFKLIQALSIRSEIPVEKIYSCLDLVAISIAADVVTMVGENRTLSYFGLKNLNKEPRIGVKSLLKSAGVGKKMSLGEDQYFKKKITVSDLVFLLGPRINAAGRIESATDSVRLLISNNIEYAEKLGKQINDLNTTRRELDSNITKEALQILNEDKNINNKKATIVYNDNWHKGVVGIVASRLIDSYYRPTIVLTKADGILSGSARSVKNFDIYDAIDSTSHLLENFGGHKYAAGLALKPENLDEFISKFQDYADKHISEDMLVPEIEIDAELFISDINFKFYKILMQFAPFGPGNMSPVFQTKNVIDTGFAKLVGKKDNKHLKFSVVHPDRTGNPVPAIAFNQGRHLEEMEKGTPFEICYHIDENTWLGSTTLQLRVLDIRF
ncbi:MAG TPA: single-stranded-DNA-specific exonuclease RecJ [Bacteroidales bacterium]|jgi:single-stranded-DNA-specific exonuclease|nr:single-stranded-DNA-specific exonuclease RecJ [Bacteroidota bacterium]HJN05809.1 single-stranded-DNA-specific exonuclease RecJ [Bacteroidales bacterium]|tara:strand:+ start:1016 stop:2764 length:1749 start_codon:yes stop_codon:yes gene_type:complete